MIVVLFLFYEPFWFFTPFSRFLECDYMILRYLIVIFPVCVGVLFILVFLCLSLESKNVKRGVKVRLGSTRSRNHSPKILKVE